MTYSMVLIQPGHSCQALLIPIIEEIQYALDRHHHVELIMQDFCKAFDTVAHNRLLNKLKFYGIQGKIYDWLYIWLMQRTQLTCSSGWFLIQLC